MLLCKRASLLIVLLAAVWNGGASGPATALDQPKAVDVRLEAVGDIQWSAAPIDPSRGSARYWLRASVVAEHGRATGGISIAMPGRAAGRVTGFRMESASGAAPPRATITGIVDYHGITYRATIAVLSDSRSASPRAGARSTRVPGSISIVLTPTGPGAGEPSRGKAVDRASVMFRFKEPATSTQRREGGAVRAP